MPAPYALDHRVTYHDVGPSPLTVWLIAIAALILLLNRDPGIGRAKWYLALRRRCDVPCDQPDRLQLLHQPRPAWQSPATCPRSWVSPSACLKGVLDALPCGCCCGFVAMAVAWSLVVMLFNSTNRLIPPSLVPVRIGNRERRILEHAVRRLELQGARSVAGETRTRTSRTPSDRADSPVSVSMTRWS